MSRNAVLGFCTAVLLLTSAGISSFTIFLPSIEAEFGWSRATVTVPFTISMVAWGISAPLFGKLADDYGARRVILGGTVLMAAGFLITGLAQNLWQLSLSFGVMVGLALGAASLTLISVLVSKHFDTGNRGLAVSVVQTATPLNPLLFAPLLFFLTTTFDWRIAALAISAMLAGIALPLAWVGAREPASAQLARNIRLGWGAYLPYLRNRSVILLFAARFACGLAFSQMAHLVALAMSKGFDPAVGATAVSVFGASAVASALLFGRLADRYGPGRMLGLSYFVRGAGTIALAFATPSELWFYALVVVGIGPTFGTVAVNNVMLFEVVGPRLAGAVLGLSFVVHQVGSAGGPLLGSIVYDLTQTYDGFLLVMGLVLLASGVMTYNIRPAGIPMPGHAIAATSSQA